YTEALLRAIPRLDQPSHSRLLAIGGRPPDLVEPPPGCRFSPRCEYARDRCRVDEPLLEPALDAGHSFACWYPVAVAPSALHGQGRVGLLARERFTSATKPCSASRTS